MSTRIHAEPGSPFIEVVREFDAPRDVVLRAWTDPALVARWLGPRRLGTRIDHWDLEPRGGTYRYVNVEPDGTEYGFRGAFHPTSDPYTLVQTFEFEGAPGHVSLDALTLEDARGRTVARIRSVYQTVEARDAMVASGMESGLSEGFERLDELLAGELAPAR